MQFDGDKKNLARQARTGVKQAGWLRHKSRLPLLCPLSLPWSKPGGICCKHRFFYKLEFWFSPVLVCLSMFIYDFLFHLVRQFGH